MHIPSSSSTTPIIDRCRTVCRVATLGCAFALLCTAAPGIAQELDGWLIQRVSEPLSIEAGSRVEVINSLGDIRVRFSEGPESEVLAVVQRAEDDPRPAPRLQVTRSAESGLRIEVVSEGGPPTEEEHAKRRVDLSLFLPEGSPLIAHSSGGLVEAKGLRSDLELSTTEQGEIVASSTGSINARSVHGDIQAEFSRNAERRSRLLSTTGDIRAILSSAADALIEASTTGDLVTDFTVDIRYPEGGTRKQVRARLGNAQKHQLLLETVNGLVRLQRANDWIELEAQQQSPQQQNH